MAAELGSAPVNIVPAQTFAVPPNEAYDFGSSVQVSDADGGELSVTYMPITEP